MRTICLFVMLAGLAAAPASAQDQLPRSQPGWPCVGTPDPSYFRVAEASGGQVFLFDKSEIGSSAMVAVMSRRFDETLFRAAGSLVQGRHEFSFPIDSAVEGAMISVSLQCLESVEIVTPSGQLVQNSAGAELHSFRAGRVVSLRQPEAGVWRVRVAGRGMFFLVAEARSDLSLDRVDFVREGGRPGHEGLFPTHEPPHAGVPQLLEIEVAGEVRDIRARLVTSAFTDAGSLTLRESPGSSAHAFLATITPPAAPFRIVVTGVDALGHPFQRVHAPLFEPE